MPPTPPVDQTVFLHVRGRFEARARALFYARLALMTISLGVLVIPAWGQALNVSLPVGAYWYLGILCYQVASYLWVGRRGARAVVFATLCLDLLVFLYLVAASGGIKSPLMPTQLVFTMLFALLFPKPLAILPPLLTLPILAKIDQILGTQDLPNDLLLLLWYIALNVAVVYVMVYLDSQERGAFKEVVRLQRERRRAALVDERARIAREIHDSVGAALSGVMLQAEYLLSQVSDREIKEELHELRDGAQEGMEELRRAVSVMRLEFHLPSAAEDYVAAFSERHRLPVTIEKEGPELDLDPEPQLVLFRVLQEALNNTAKHAQASQAQVSLRYTSEYVELAVSDDGQGFDLQEKVPGHYGIQNMKERASKLGGICRVTSAPEQGTRVMVRLPVGGGD